MFAGLVSDNFDERIEQKIFHAEIVVDNAAVARETKAYKKIPAEIVVDNAAVARETKAYKKIPQIVDFHDENGNGTMLSEIERNYSRIKPDVKQIVADELSWIENDPELQHLRKKE